MFAEDHGFGHPGPEIYVLHGNGTLEAYDGQSYSLLWRTTYAPNGIAAAALIADIDDDGRLEVVIAADYSVRAYDLESATLEWEFAADRSKTVHAGDVDGDGELEVVVGAGDFEAFGYVLNGRTGVAEWTYHGGFGRSVQLRDVTGDGIADIVGQYVRGAVTAFDVVRKTPLWQIDIEAYNPWTWIAFRDVDRDGTDELLVALAHGEVRAYSVSPTRRLLWTKQLSTEDQLVLFDVGDTDGDGIEDFVARKGYYQPRVVSGSLADGSLAWRSERRKAPFHVSVGDTDGDRVPEVAVINARPDRGIYYTIDMVDGRGNVTSSRDVDWLPHTTIHPRALTDLDQNGRPK